MNHPESRDPEPIATSAEFRAALLRVRNTHGMSETNLSILRAFCSAPGHVLTAPRLAEAVGFTNSNESNLRFGMMAKLIGEALGFEPSVRYDGSLRWWQSAAYGAESDEDETGHFQWTLHPELVQALLELPWGMKPRSAHPK